MRFLLAGLLILVFPVAALAQAKGQVLSVGFNNHYRPDCWTPMLIQLTSQSSDSTDYEIQIAQEDLDRDKVVYTQHVTLGGNVEGHAATSENFWVYFRPQPTGGGLPDATQINMNLTDLNKELKVILCNKDGKPLGVLPNTSTIFNVDPKRPTGDETRSRKFVVVVTDGSDKPVMPYDPALNLHGVVEDVDVQTVQPRDLPNNVIGYEAVDTLVWMDADANFLSTGTRTPALEAIRQYVRQGGHLVVCEPAESFKIKPFADLLPISSTVTGGDWTIRMADCKDETTHDQNARQDPLGILRRLAQANYGKEAWKTIKGSFKVGQAVPTGDAKVDEWIEWQGKASTFHTPWLARRGVGLGAVTWVAQDLGNPALTSNTKGGWRFIWDRVFDWKSAQVADDWQPPLDSSNPWLPNSGVDLGLPLLKGMDLTNKAAYLVSLACLFFVAYWLAAGPGVYLFLAAKKRTHLSWFYFGLAALVATLITVLLVKIVVRGPPELRHVSVVRYAAGEPDGIVNSRFGLYIPQDGDKQIDVPGTAEHEVSFIAPFGINPQYVSSDDTFPAYLEYKIPVRDPSDTSPLSVTIPYRSTSKKLEVQWIGDVKNKVEMPTGSMIKLTPRGDGGYIDGTLVNHTGNDLFNVYFAFKEPLYVDEEPSAADQDYLIYLPQWPKDGQLRLKDLTITRNLINLELTGKRHPGGSDPAFGTLGSEAQWQGYWWAKADANANGLETALPMLTLFDRLLPWQNQPDRHLGRFEFYRRNARHLNLSPALSAGQLVVVATASVNGDPAKTPLPFQLNVSDSPVAGEGTTIVQYVFPIDRHEMSHEPSTRPVTAATQSSSTRP